MPKLNKAKQVRRDKDKMKNFSVGIYDIDSAFKNFLEKDVKPTVEDDGRFYPVPVMYASPERWYAMQRQGFLRDKRQKILTPVIVFRRTGIEKNENIRVFYSRIKVSTRIIWFRWGQLHVLPIMYKCYR